MKFCEKCYSIQKENAKFCNQCGNKLPCEIEAYTEADFEIKDGTLTKYIGDSECVKIPTTVNRIGRQAFCENKTLKSVIIPETVTVIMDNAFCGCENLTYVHLPSSLTMIGTGSFHGCEALKSIKIPESVTHLGQSAFTQSGLESIVIPDSVKTIGANAFSNCKNLTSVYIPVSVEELAFSAVTSKSTACFPVIFTVTVKSNTLPVVPAGINLPLASLIGRASVMLIPLAPSV